MSGDNLWWKKCADHRCALWQQTHQGSGLRLWETLKFSERHCLETPHWPHPGRGGDQAVLPWRPAHDPDPHYAQEAQDQVRQGLQETLEEWLQYLYNLIQSPKNVDLFKNEKVFTAIPVSSFSDDVCLCS